MIRREHQEATEQVTVVPGAESGNAHRGDYLRSAQAAVILRVSAKTVYRWARQGRLPHVTTLGGHRRYRRADVEHLAQVLEQRPAFSRKAVV